MCDMAHIVDGTGQLLWPITTTFVRYKRAGMAFESAEVHGADVFLQESRASFYSRSRSFNYLLPYHSFGHAKFRFIVYPLLYKY